MKVSNFSVIKWILLLTVVFLSACAGFGDGETAVLPPTPTLASPTSMPTETATQIPSPTRPPEETTIPPTSTLIPSTQVAIPTQTPIPAQTVTLTPRPTLPPVGADEKVLLLLEDNQNPNCLLPCWWWATPGQTWWQDIESFLKTFAIEISESSHGASVEIPVPESIVARGFSYVYYSWDESGMIRSISIPSLNIAGYDPKTMMSLYGVPDEVWLRTFSEILPGEVLPFNLILIYQEKGISFRYYVDSTTDGEMNTVCFEPGVVELERPDLFPVGPRIYLWEPGLYKAIDEIVKTTDETYYPLAEKTDLTPLTFYEKFINSKESPCIDTPSNLWN